MEIAMLGLGKMGGNMVQRLMQGGHRVIAYDVNPKLADELATKGAVAAHTIDEVLSKFTGPKAVWSMVPSGKITEDLIHQLADKMKPGDVIIDGGNSNFHDSMRRAQECAAKNIGFLDAGTSGGIWGLKVGYCLMVGGDDKSFAMVEPAFKTLGPPNGVLHTGPAGSGHFVKMVHNGVEYGLMTAYAEGFEIMKTAPFKDLPLDDIANLWNQGSVVRSWLLELLADALKKDPKLDELKGYVEDSGEGRWTVQAAIDQNVPAPVITLSLLGRIASRQDESFSAKVQAALRNEFGGHAVKKS